jgi:hypothetical protein
MGVDLESTLKFTLLSKYVRDFCSEGDKTEFAGKSSKFEQFLKGLIDKDVPEKPAPLTRFARLLLGDELQELDGLVLVVPTIPLQVVTFDQHAVYMTALRLIRFGVRIHFIFLERFAGYALGKSYIQQGAGTTGMSQKHIDYIEGMLNIESKASGIELESLKEKILFISEDKLTKSYATNLSFDSEWITNCFSHWDSPTKIPKDFRFGVEKDTELVCSNMLLRSFLLVKKHMNELDSQRDKHTVLLIPSIRYYIAKELRIPEEQILQTWYFDTYLDYSNWFLDQVKKSSPDPLYSIQGWSELDSDSLEEDTNKLEYYWLWKHNPLCLKQMGFIAGVDIPSLEEIFGDGNEGPVPWLNLIHKQTKSLVTNIKNHSTFGLNKFATLFGSEFLTENKIDDVQWSTIMIVYFSMLNYINNQNGTDILNTQIECKILTHGRMHGIPTALKTVRHRNTVIRVLEKKKLVRIVKRKDGRANGDPELIEVILFNVNMRSKV